MYYLYDTSTNELVCSNNSLHEILDYASKCDEIQRANLAIGYENNIYATDLNFVDYMASLVDIIENLIIQYNKLKYIDDENSKFLLRLVSDIAMNNNIHFNENFEII